MKKICCVFILLLGAITLPGCRKGEEDPMLSLRSRKARLTGEWKVSHMEITNIINGVTEKDVFDGTTMTYSSGNSVSYSSEYTFEKDGTYSLETMAGTSGYSQSGNWFFLGKNKEDGTGKKEEIMMDITYSSDAFVTNVYNNFGYSNQVVHHLDKLSEKEMKWTFTHVYTYSGTTDKTETIVETTLLKK